MNCPRCNVWCWEWEHSPGQEWCSFCGMDPLVEGPPPPPAELKGLADVIGTGSINAEHIAWRK